MPFNLKGFVMIIRKLLAVGLLFFISIPSSYALKCQKDGAVSDSTTITTTTAIMNSKPAGTILWRQPTQTIEVECWVDVSGAPDENIYLYINPAKTELGPDIDIGITYGGKDYLSSSLTGGKLSIGWQVSGCGAGTTCGWQKEKKSLTYSIFFLKKSPAGANKEGLLSPINNYKAFQLDGAGGVRLGSSYNLTVNGLNKFRYVPCTSIVSISPTTVNFGKLSNVNAQIGATITSVPFSINEQRDCDASYGLNANLEPLNGTLSTTRDTLTPSNNTSVGISLIKADDQTAVKFKQEFALIPMTTSRNNSRRFLARLKWMTAPKLGAFNAGAVLNIYYK
ncbi:Fimbrial protein [Pseudomonas chlororaphis]|uniref:fimbrial protein n=1 Tax=Pseudomonas chlororaphis TaxID=587753 RepID=UPI0039E43FB3